MECQVRPARPDDAEEVSRVILLALRETNANDYPPETIARVERSFSAGAVLDLMTKRTVFVATSGPQIVGTASLDGNVIRTVFVVPVAQGQGVGKQLMAMVEQTARDLGIAMLMVPSSVTAEQFYAKLGFKAVRDRHYDDERTIVMERSLTPLGDRSGSDSENPRTGLQPSAE